jgi:hypothetical protein
VYPSVANVLVVDACILVVRKYIPSISPRFPPNIRGIEVVSGRPLLTRHRHNNSQDTVAIFKPDFFEKSAEIQIVKLASEERGGGDSYPRFSDEKITCVRSWRGVGEASRVGGRRIGRSRACARARLHPHRHRRSGREAIEFTRLIPAARPTHRCV